MNIHLETDILKTDILKTDILKTDILKNMNQNQYKQFIQNMKNQHTQCTNKIKLLEN